MSLLKSIIGVLVGAAVLLLIPLTAAQFVDGWNWSNGDYVFAWIMFAVTGLLFVLARWKASGNGSYKLAAGMAIVATFLLVWVNGAVGIIGDSDINMLYAVVVLTLFIGSIIARFKPQGMAYAVFAAALVQFSIPIIALILREPDFSPGVGLVLILNMFWVLLYAGSGVLFRQAGAKLKPAA